MVFSYPPLLVDIVGALRYNAPISTNYLTWYSLYRGGIVLAYHTLPPLLGLKAQEIIRDYTPVSTLTALNRGATEVATLIRDYLYYQFEL